MSYEITLPMKLDRLSLLMLDLCDSGLERLCIWRISVTIWSGFWVATMKPKLLVLAIALSLIFIVLAGLNRSQGTLFWCYDSKLCPISACMQWMLCLATYIAPMKETEGAKCAKISLWPLARCVWQQLKLVLHAWICWSRARFSRSVQAT